MEVSLRQTGRRSFYKVVGAVMAFLFVGLTFAFLNLNELQLRRIMAASRSTYASFTNQFMITTTNTTSTRGTATTSMTSSRPAFRLLMGILTVPDLYDRRNMVRLIYGTQKPKISQIDVKFVFCNVTNPDDRVLVSLEIMLYDDIIILNCKENMNDGKTYTYFSSLPDLFDYSPDGAPPYDYVMKGDDDVFFRINPLEESLKDKPKKDMYYGFVIPCSNMDPFNQYMSGMGYILSWDLVEFIKNSTYARNHTVGAEDMMTGSWLSAGRIGNHRFNNKPEMYEFPQPEPSFGCAHDFIPNTIAVHKLKNYERWVETLTYFNFTNSIKPSKLYHIHR